VGLQLQTSTDSSHDRLHVPICRPQSAQADFVIFQPRFQPPGVMPAAAHHPSAAANCRA
jgi:hypothetical protein